ncbi:MAG: hypothetical protein N2572_02245 [Syntrophales bacterium]|nr:hypothetical protein [Syntrophales bacterium]
MKKIIGLFLALTGILLFLFGCGGGTSGTGPLRGIFVDAPVEGLDYTTTSGITGRTDANGGFFYDPGDTVNFKIGNLNLGSAKGAAQITPVDIISGATANDQRVVNMLVLLQTLDEDGNPNNGIKINTATRNVISANASNINFNQTPNSFQGDTKIATLLTTLNATAGAFTGGARTLRGVAAAVEHFTSSTNERYVQTLPAPQYPIVFVHGGSGSASQFESQAQRFIANGYPLNFLYAFEHDTSSSTTDVITAQAAQLETFIDGVLAKTGASKVDLIGHSRGTTVSHTYLSVPSRAAKVARYINVDGRTATSLPGGVPTLALWADGWLSEKGPPKDPYSGKIEGAENVYILNQAHIEVCTSAEAFWYMFRFLMGVNPKTVQIPEKQGNTVKIAGKTNYFPANTGALGTLYIYEINPNTAARVSDTPVATFTIDSSGNWGPVDLKKGATYEFAFHHANGSKHYFYREPFLTDNYFVRLNTSNPASPTSLGNLLTRTNNHTSILISRDKEMWGDQGDNSDILTVDGTNVMTNVAAPRTKHLSGLFLVDWGPNHSALSTSTSNPPDQKTDLTTPISIFHSLTFFSGLDLYLPASIPWNKAITLSLTPRGGGGKVQTIKVPNWASSDVRISVIFRDYVQ